MKQSNEVISSGFSPGRGARCGTTAKGQRTPERPQQGTGSGLAANDKRCRLIAEAAYYRAQARGFAPGQEIEDWLQPEAEIDRMFRDA
ncbi:MAG: DUF2934 domain-containing protein [Pseudomonadota bacterium]